MKNIKNKNANFNNANNSIERKGLPIDLFLNKNDSNQAGVTEIRLDGFELYESLYENQTKLVDNVKEIFKEILPEKTIIESKKKDGDFFLSAKLDGNIKIKLQVSLEAIEDFSIQDDFSQDKAIKLARNYMEKQYHYLNRDKASVSESKWLIDTGILFPRKVI